MACAYRLRTSANQERESADLIRRYCFKALLDPFWRRGFIR